MLFSKIGLLRIFMCCPQNVYLFHIFIRCSQKFTSFTLCVVHKNLHPSPVYVVLKILCLPHFYQVVRKKYPLFIYVLATKMYKYSYLHVVLKSLPPPHLYILFLKIYLLHIFRCFLKSLPPPHLYLLF